MNSSQLRKTHRWLGAVAAAQLLIWTGSGLFFAVVPIDAVRGTHLLAQPASFRLGYVALVSPSSLVRQHKELSMVSLNQIQISQRLNTPVYIIEAEEGLLVFDAETAEKLAPLSELEASALAASSASLPVRSASWVTAVEAGSEYRDGELPAWRVELVGPEQVNLWIGANSGKVRAVRTNTWRVYDFLWSLHIMDYNGRNNFNSWLLRVFALLGCITVVSGIVLLVLYLRRKKIVISRA